MNNIQKFKNFFYGIFVLGFIFLLFMQNIYFVEKFRLTLKNEYVSTLILKLQIFFYSIYKNEIYSLIYRDLLFKIILIFILWMGFFANEQIIVNKEKLKPVKKDYVYLSIGLVFFLCSSFIFLSNVPYNTELGLLNYIGNFICMLLGGILIVLRGYKFITYYKSFIVKNSNNNRIVENKKFLQVKNKIETPASVNIPYIPFGYEDIHYINIINPYMSSIIFGTPGKGKTFIMVAEYLSQLIDKNFTGIVYDYKNGDLTDLVIKYHHRTKQKAIFNNENYNVELAVLNFEKPVRGARMNPLDRKILLSDDHCVSIVDSLLCTLNKKWIENKDFWASNAINFVSAAAKFLRNTDLLIYDEKGSIKERKNCCSLAHLIALCLLDVNNYDLVYAIMNYEPNKYNILGFLDALKKDAEQQLAGMFGTIQTEMAKLNSDRIFFLCNEISNQSMNINDPKKPQIICVKYDNQLGGALTAIASSYLTQACLSLNQKDRLPSFIVIDEASTIYVKKLDEVIATGRSNKVATTLVFQDMSQMVRDYGQNVADALINTVGNKITFQVDGKTADYMAALFADVEKMKEGYSANKEGVINNKNLSYEKRKTVEPSDLSGLLQGQCAGRLQSEVGMEKKIHEIRFIGTAKPNLKRDKIDIGKSDYYPIFDEDIKTYINNHPDYINIKNKNNITDTDKKELYMKIEDTICEDLYKSNAKRIYQEVKDLVLQNSLFFQIANEGNREYPNTNIYKT